MISLLSEKGQPRDLTWNYFRPCKPEIRAVDLTEVFFTAHDQSTWVVVVVVVVVVVYGQQPKVHLSCSLRLDFLTQVFV